MLKLFQKSDNAFKIFTYLQHLVDVKFHNSLCNLQFRTLASSVPPIPIFIQIPEENIGIWYRYRYDKIPNISIGMNFRYQYLVLVSV